MKIPFFNVGKLNQEIAAELLAAAREIIDGGTYLLGERLNDFEQELAQALGGGDPGFAVGCNSGTDAIRLPLLAHQIGPGDEVITVAHTAIPTAAAIVSTGATPVFADVNAKTWVMDCERLPELIGPNTRAIVPVHLYGNMVDVSRLRQILAELGRSDIIIIEDTAQAHGSADNGRLAGTIGDYGAFSFYPTKNLGALGDAGAVYCRSPERAEYLRWLRHYGQRSRYRADIAGGTNSRLDELQAAFLLRKLPHMERWNRRKAELLQRYQAALQELPVEFQQPTAGCTVAWHLCVIRLQKREIRDTLRRHLEEAGIETLIHYPIPLHRQAAFAPFVKRCGAAGTTALPVTEQLADCIVSLPLNPMLSDMEQAWIVERIGDFFPSSIRR